MGVVQSCEVTGAVPYSYIGWAVDAAVNDAKVVRPSNMAMKAMMEQTEWTVNILAKAEEWGHGHMMGMGADMGA